MLLNCVVVIGVDRLAAVVDVDVILLLNVVGQAKSDYTNTHTLAR